MNGKIKILIADDHQIVRMGLTTILGREPGFAVVGEARNGLEAVRLGCELKPDIILMDLMMPRKGGADATREILAAAPSVKVLILTTYGESEEVKRALDAGALGALVKDTPHAKIIAALRDVARGTRVISPEIRQNLAAQSVLPKLSERQCEILGLVAEGLTTKVIADRLEIGPDGVNAHLRTIFAKLGVSSRSEAVAIALKRHLLKNAPR